MNKQDSSGMDGTISMTVLHEALLSKEHENLFMYVSHPLLSRDTYGYCSLHTQAHLHRKLIWLLRHVYVAELKLRASFTLPNQCDCSSPKLHRVHWHASNSNSSIASSKPQDFNCSRMMGWVGATNPSSHWSFREKALIFGKRKSCTVKTAFSNSLLVFALWWWQRGRNKGYNTPHQSYTLAFNNYGLLTPPSFCLSIFPQAASPALDES